MSREPNGPRVVLIGLRGAGKTAVGPLLAELLRVPWHDSDRWIAARDESPATLIATNRAEELRSREREAVAELSRLPGLVLSLGGGAVESPQVLESLKGWRAFLLDAPDSVLAERLAADPTDRPPLSDLPLREEIASVRKRRWTLYTALHPMIIATSYRSPAQIAEEIAEVLSAGDAAGEVAAE